jgi:hypothetical protein
MVDPIALKVIVRDLLRVEEDYRSALPGAPVRADSGRRLSWRRWRWLEWLSERLGKSS